MTANSSSGVVGAIKNLLVNEYAFIGGEKIQDMLAEQLTDIYKSYSRDPWNLESGEILWFAVDKDEKHSYGKIRQNLKRVPVILSFIHEDDQRARANGCSHKDARKLKIVRLLKECYSQGGVLTQSDLAEILGISVGTVGKDIREYQDETKEILPYRGVVHDIGPSVTHKRLIVSMFIKNIPTPDISKRTYHTEEACDRYIKAFKNVRTLYDKMRPVEIARTLDMSERLVGQYIEMIEEIKDSGEIKNVN